MKARVHISLKPGVLDPGPGGGRVGLGDLQFDQLALPDFADIGKAEPLQGIADRLPLRVEDARLEADMNPRLHRFATRTLLHQSWRLEIDRPALGQDTETAGHLPVALLDPAEILAEAVLVHLFVGARVP